MFSPGKLILFDPFYFKNGGSKRKYFLVLKVMDGEVLLATLPSSKVHLPADQPATHGCLEIENIGVNCYIFEENRPITKCGWSFELNTYCYGSWIDDYSITALSEKHSIPGVDYEIVGELTNEELQNIILCFKNSASVKRKYRRLLNH